MSNIRAYLDSLNPAINKILLKTGAVLSGSTALYFYLKENDIDPCFELQDLDIYMGYKNGYSEFMKLYDELFKDKDFYSNFNAISFYSGKPYLPCPEAMQEDIPKPLVSCIDYVRVGYINDVKIDFIQISKELSTTYEDNISKFIEKYIDLDFCKCCWDGKKFIVFHHDEIINKTCKLQKFDLTCFSRHPLDIEKLVKYQIVLQTNNFTPETRALDYFNLIKRIEKYRSRGFTINTSNLYFFTPQLVKRLANDCIKEKFMEYSKILSNIGIELYYDVRDSSENNITEYSPYYEEYKHSKKQKAYIKIETMVQVDDQTSKGLKIKKKKIIVESEEEY